jgi:hypothetical protein
MGRRIIIRTVKKAKNSHKQKFDFICTDDDVHVVQSTITTNGLQQICVSCEI